jgi:hypothetical protein
VCVCVCVCVCVRAHAWCVRVGAQIKGAHLFNITLFGQQIFSVFEVHVSAGMQAILTSIEEECTCIQRSISVILHLKQRC